MMRTSLVIALLLVPTAWAADDEWQQEERDVEMRELPGRVTATSSGTEDRIDVVFDASPARLSYVFTDDDGTRLHIEQRVAAIVEWEDADGDGQYSLGDRTVHRTALDGTTASTSTGQSPDGHHAWARYTILGASEGIGSSPAAPGSFTIAFDVLGRPVQKDGRTITPTEVPIRLTVEDFPFREEGTELAFEVRVSTDTVLDRAAGHPVVVREGNHTTFYTWQERARLDGRTVDARATEMVRSPSDPEDTIIYYAFASGDAEQGTTIGTLRKMPSLQDIPVPRTAGDVALFLLGIVGMAAAVGVPAWRRMRSP